MADKSATSNGKGDTPRPIVVDPETFKKNWEQTFWHLCDFCCEERARPNSHFCSPECHEAEMGDKEEPNDA
jgi:hypothetical protein